MPSAPPIKAARGVRDILPAERAAWRWVEEAARATARNYGYQEIETPILEQVELIERVGEDTDAAGKELFRVQPMGGQRLALRPEATVGVVRAYFEGALHQHPQPVRLFFTGAMFRHDAPQKLRYRQFYQFDVEAIGDASPALDAEVIEVAWEWLASVGLARVRLLLNSIGDSVCRPAYLEALRAYYRPLRDQLCPQCRDRIETNPLRLLDCKEDGCQALKAGAPRSIDHLCEPCARHFEEVRRLLDRAGIEYSLDPFLVRGLDYYTRTVFELQHESLGGAQNALGGGGRYDGLAAAINWQDTPGVGFAGGIDRVVHVLREEGQEVVSAPAAELIVLTEPNGGEDLAGPAAELARIARAVVPTAVDYSGRSLRAQMRAAGKADAHWVAIINADEAAARRARLRDMPAHEQREVTWEELAGLLANAGT